MPIDLEAPENFLFAFNYNDETYAVSVSGRTEAEARHLFGTMSVAEKRSRIVAGLNRGDRDFVADFASWIAAVVGFRIARRPV